MNFRTTRAVFLFALVAAACLDPLYEEGAPLDSAHVLCCPNGTVDTCFCEKATSCPMQNFSPCAAGRCVPKMASCPAAGGGAGGGSGGGGHGTGGGGGASGGGGGASGGGAGGGGGAADAGEVDGGTVSDAGVADGGVADGGMGGGTGGGTGGGSGGGGAGGGGGGGGGGAPAFEFCCVNSRVTTCSCPLSGCGNAPFTPCPGGTCVAGTTTSICR